MPVGQALQVVIGLTVLDRHGDVRMSVAQLSETRGEQVADARGDRTDLDSPRDLVVLEIVLGALHELGDLPGVVSKSAAGIGEAKAAPLGHDHAGSGFPFDAAQLLGDGGSSEMEQYGSLIDRSGSRHGVEDPQP
nr:hypothetical protein [Brevibacterium linens]